MIDQKKREEIFLAANKHLDRMAREKRQNDRIATNMNLKREFFHPRSFLRGVDFVISKINEVK